MTKALTVAGHEFSVVEDEGAPWVALRDLCEPLGLKIQGQKERLSRAPWATLQMICGVRTSGLAAEMFGLHIRSVPMFFATLTSSRVRPQFREPLERFQREVADAVAADEEGGLQ